MKQTFALSSDKKCWFNTPLLNCFLQTLQVCDTFFFLSGPFKWISVMHGRRHQDSMNTFAHDKQRWGRGGGESISLAMSHWLHCFILFPGSRGFTSAMLPHKEEWRRWKAWVWSTHGFEWEEEKKKKATQRGNEGFVQRWVRTDVTVIQEKTSWSGQPTHLVDLVLTPLLHVHACSRATQPEVH